MIYDERNKQITTYYIVPGLDDIVLDRFDYPCRKQLVILTHRIRRHLLSCNLSSVEYT